MHRLEIAHGEGFGIGDDQVIVGRVLLDGVDHAGGGELRGLDGDGARPGADVPDNAGGLHVELGERESADLGLGDEPALGPALGEHVVGVAEPALHRGRPLLVGPAGLALEDHHVERRELHLGDLGQLGLSDALVGAAEVLADVGAEVVQPAGQQLPGDLRRPLLLAGKQSHRLGRAHLVEDVLQGMSRQVGEVGLLPGLLDAGKGELHRADVGQDLEFILAETVAQVARDAVEERVAAGHDGHALLAKVAFQGVHHLGEVGADRQLFGPQLRDEREGMLRAEHKLCRLQQLARSSGQPACPIAADAEDVDFRFGRHVGVPCRSDGSLGGQGFARVRCFAQAASVLLRGGFDGVSSA